MKRADVPHSWRVALALRARRVERRLGRALTDEEWERFERHGFGMTDPLRIRQLFHSVMAAGAPWVPAAKRTHDLVMASFSRWGEQSAYMGDHS